MLLESIEPTLSLVAVVEAIEKIFPKLRTFHDQEAHGGYLCVANQDSGVPNLIIGVGTVQIDSQTRFLGSCQAEAIRLAEQDDDVSSVQSRGAEHGNGVAIFSLDEIISFDGPCPWELNESFCLLLAIELGDIDIAEAIDIATQSGNTRFEGILAHF